MTRAHRRSHLAIWLVAGPAAVILLVLALSSKRTAPVQSLPPQVQGAAP
ncbi:MAG: hypothetical protein ACKVU4_03360 [Phycisphaerales bacterium]